MIVGRFWEPSWLQNRSTIDLDTKMSKLSKLSSRVDESLIFADFRALKSIKCWSNLIKKSINKLITVLIDFLIGFGRFWGPSWNQNRPNIDQQIDKKLIKCWSLFLSIFDRLWTRKIDVLGINSKKDDFVKNELPCRREHDF